MPFREAIVGDLRLTAVGGKLPSPVYVGEVAGKPLVVRFDYGALGYLAGKGDLRAIEAVLEEKRDAVRLAAQNLLREGHWTEKADGIEVQVTALDL